MMMKPDPQNLQHSIKKNGAKHRQPGFYLKTTRLTMMMRRVCKDKLPRRSGALAPFKNLEIDGIKVSSKNKSILVIFGL